MKTILYRGKVYVAASKGQEAAHRKERLVKALKKIPAKWRKGLTVKIVKSLSGQGAVHRPHSGEVRVESEELSNRYNARAKGVDDVCRNSGMDWLQESSNRFFSQKELSRFGPNDYGDIYVAHLIAHEVGHHVCDSLHSDARMKFIALAGKTKFVTDVLRTYTRWVDEKIRDNEEMGGFLPNTIKTRVAREKFAEMFRLFIMEGKFKPFFAAVDKALKEKPPKAAEV